MSEFTYPIYKKSTKSELVVRFDGLNSGVVVAGDSSWEIGECSVLWIEYTNENEWQDWTPPSDDWEKAEARMNVIGQNGNDGLHYEDTDNKDNVNPGHYKVGGIETIDYMKAKSTTEEFTGHLRLTAIKYLSRYGHKDDTLQELKKAKWYLDKLIKELEE